MAILSMTGFGRASLAFEGRDYAVEIKTVNHRYLDCRVKLPRALASAESSLRAQVGSCVQRGRVELSIQSIGSGDIEYQDVSVDFALAEGVLNAHKALASRLGVDLNCTSKELAAYPGVVRSSTVEFDEGSVADFAHQLTAPALVALRDMRANEGQRLDGLIRGHLDTLRTLTAQLNQHAPEIVGRYKERLENRITGFLESREVDVDETRLIQEVAIFSEKVDVAEELGRLAAHFSHFDRLLSSDEAVGRRMDFLCQEILREANTVGSKAQAVEMTECVVAIKAELERLREQVQNVE
ncbi:MAG: YicC/YloC family endoribonuclease [Myxococcota bacterium]|nr:YicC/YloC family endoribonuclease [Myxococcota bacterium]